MKAYTSMQLLELLESRREIRNIMGRISHDYSVKQEASVYERYFAKREDVSLGLNDGFYDGADAVRGYYAALGEEIKLSSELIQKKFPGELGEKTAEEVYGVGMMTYLPFESQIIEIAGDGQTAKGLWNVRGSYCRLTGCGPIAYWTFGWAAVDFVLEEGEWKIWHMQLLYNVDAQCGTPLTDEPKKYDPIPEFAPMDEFKMPAPNKPAKLMEHYNTERPATKSPRAPEAYETFADTFSYGA